MSNKLVRHSCFYSETMAQLKNITVGILGGGQLAKMSLQAAARMGIETAILEKHGNSPAGKLTHHEFIGSVENTLLLKKFAQQCDVITLENEFIDHHSLEFFERLGKTVIPSSHTIALIQDKLLQKEALAKAGIPVPRFVAVEKNIEFKQLASLVGLPFVLKSRKMGYDGYGNALIRTGRDFIEAKRRLSARHSTLLAESFIDFHMELAVMVVRTKKEMKTYPVVQTIQKNHICHTVIAPAPISKNLMRDAEELAVESVKAVHGYGIFGVELFLSDEMIIVNEMAPRPHNSGHYTIEGCVTSQFENHIRAVFNFPLGETSLVKKSAVMINLLGKPNPQKASERYFHGLKNPDVHLHIYGKQESRQGRKMGHITMIGDNQKQLVKKITAIEKQIRL